MTRCTTALALLTAAGLAACGGASAEDYRADAARVCREAAKQTDAVEPPARATAAAIADFFERQADVSRKTTDRFAELDVPDDLRNAHDDLVRANRDAEEQVRTIVRRVQDGDDPGKVLAEAQTKVGEATAAAREAAERLKVPACTG
jgi:hypothetical protein